MISAAVGLYGITHEQAYLDQAKRIARSAEKQFIRSEDGIITGAGKLAVKLVEAYLDLYQVDRDEHWRELVTKAVAALHGHQNSDGLYPQDWNAAPLKAGQAARLIDQAAPARAYWLLAAKP
jgi:mannose/cellobiose epimerase-like protein (N-acyl-D-glucosamine 2-epimerase family)